mmetsp:Transcript_4241/g.6093  ORF Transcript_4241/g.6093 Transcript_4241/m.6093 type:complete len:420 (+) Transcript_4241:3-1262(+)
MLPPKQQLPYFSPRMQPTQKTRKRIYNRTINTCTMGNSTPTPPPPAAAPVPDIRLPDDYKWPGNLHIEARDMADAAFLVYSWAYVLDALEKENITLEKKSLTPTEVKDIIKTHQEALKKHYGDKFDDDRNTMKSLQRLVERGGDKEADLTMEAFDADFQTKELVFGITKDSIKKRITLIFRGTENALAFQSNWMANFQLTKTGEELPDSLKGKLSSDKVWIHSGFHNYMNKDTVVEGDSETKKEQVLRMVKELVKKNPGYAVYVTGHSLGGALSTLGGYYLATDPEIPKPVSVINFASPRVGNADFREAITTLEKNNDIRFCRFVNENDSITIIPTLNYTHVGLQVKLNESPKVDPLVRYPKTSDVWTILWNAWDNSIPSAFNLGYDHSDYRERIETHKEKIAKLSVNELYKDSDLTGF